MSRTADSLARLAALRDQPGLSSRAMQRCERLIERLSAPVRLAVFGLPDAGKAAVANALVGAEVLAVGQQAAPCLLRHGTRPTAKITRFDGQTILGAADLPFAPAADAALVDLALPVEALRRMSVLNVVADASPQDMAAALRWAAARCDIAIWCSRAWTVEEQTLWLNGPEALKDHALIAATDVPAATVIGDLRGLAHSSCPLGLSEDGRALRPEAAETLRDRITGIIQDASAEDLDAADLLIVKYGIEPEHPAAPVAVAPAPGTARPASAAVARSAPLPSAEGQATLARMFQTLRQSARDLLSDLQRNTIAPEDAGPVLERVQQTFETCLDLAEDEPAFAENWPALHDTLNEASELIVLLGLETETTQAADAATLLAQVRQDMECALAA
ncbi:hypothetical protein ACN2XU_14695 [Primorskyibacter sp. 2E107]|uniref:hypothetical protein n=1 Tax=Primorskyibacter sp. 2E107 TaxID=3403458 RepID=UPI003AF65391